MIDGQSIDASEPWQSLEMLKDGRRTMLLMAIGVLKSVTPQREMYAALEVLRAALADLDGWALGMAEVIRRDTELTRPREPGDTLQ